MNKNLLIVDDDTPFRERLSRSMIKKGFIVESFAKYHDPNKMSFGEEEHRLANLRSMIALQWTWPGKKTLFMGCEFGQWKEWDFEASLDWELLGFSSHLGLSKLVADLNNMYLNHPTWAESDHESDKFEWIDCNDAEGQTLSFVKLFLK